MGKSILEEILSVWEELRDGLFEIPDPDETAASESKPHAYGSSHSHSVLLSAAFHSEEMKASGKEMGLKKLRSPASGLLFSHCACPAEPVLEQSPPAAGPKSSSQRETPATICARGGGMCTGCSAHLCWGGELKGWWTHSPHLQPQQGTAAEEMG